MGQTANYGVWELTPPTSRRKWHSSDPDTDKSLSDFWTMWNKSERRNEMHKQMVRTWVARNYNLPIHAHSFYHPAKKGAIVSVSLIRSEKMQECQREMHACPTDTHTNKITDDLAGDSCCVVCMILMAQRLKWDVRAQQQVLIYGREFGGRSLKEPPISKKRLVIKLKCVCIVCQKTKLRECSTHHLNTCNF